MADASDPMPNVSTTKKILRVTVEELSPALAFLEGELAVGRAIEIVRNGTVVAEVRARQGEGTVRPNAPDFMARMKARWGDRVFSDSTQWIRDDRDAQF